MQMDDIVNDEVTITHSYSADANELKIEQWLEFDDFESFQAVLKRRHQHLGEKWVKDKELKSVKRANKFIEDKRRHYKDEFQYANIRMLCDRSGTYFSRAVVKKSSTKKQNCPAYIKVKAHRGKDKLIVTSCHLEHNHELYLSKRFPSRKKWTEEELECTQGTDGIDLIYAENESTPKATSVAPTIGNNLVLKNHHFQIIRPKEVAATTISFTPNTNPSPKKYIAYLGGKQVRIPKFQNLDKTSANSNSNNIVLNLDQLHIPVATTNGSIVNIPPSSSSQNPLPIRVHKQNFPQVLRLQIDKGSTSTSNVNGRENFIHDGNLDMNMNDIVKNDSAKQDDLSKEHIMELVESRFKEFEKKESFRQSKHFTYGLTVIERLDSLDYKAALNARKDIDDILLKYVLALGN